MSILNIKESKYDIAYGILNNSDIQMEKNNIACDYMTMLNKVNMYKVLMYTNSTEQAQICMNQASHIVEKYGLNFNLNIDIRKLMKENATRAAELKNLQEQQIQSSQNISSNVPQSQEVSVSEQKPENNLSSEDGEIVDPNEFFS
jgi:hypothetical protein